MRRWHIYPHGISCGPSSPNKGWCIVSTKKTRRASQNPVPSWWRATILWAPWTGSSCWKSSKRCAQTSRSWGTNCWNASSPCNRTSCPSTPWKGALPRLPPVCGGCAAPWTGSPTDTRWWSSPPRKSVDSGGKPKKLKTGFTRTASFAFWKRPTSPFFPRISSVGIRGDFTWPPPCSRP